MDEKIFQTCLSEWLNHTNGKPFWDNLAKQYGYSTGETLRGMFKNERKKRGLTKEGLLGEVKDIHQEAPPRPRIAVVDIENLPGTAYFWGLYDQNIGTEQIILEPCFLSWAGRLLDEPEVKSDILTRTEALSRNASRIAKSCWDFLSQCDVVIGHNFANFDAKVINTAFLEYNLPPLKYTIVDTLQVARQNFRFTSNKLKHINDVLGIRNKIDNEGLALWKKCSEGSKEALNTMLEYNEGDILATEELFYRLRPYVKGLNISLYTESTEEQCPVCGSTKIESIGAKPSGSGMYVAVRCNECGCISRRKQNLLSQEKRKSLLVKL